MIQVPHVKQVNSGIVNPDELRLNKKALGNRCGARSSIIKGYNETDFRQQLVLILGLVLSILLIPHSVYAAGSNLTSFTYSGTDTAVVDGTNFMLSANGGEISICQNTPSTEDVDGEITLTYITNCLSNMADFTPYNKYTATSVEFLGSKCTDTECSNPTNYFAVGGTMVTQNTSTRIYTWSSAIFLTRLRINSTGAATGLDAPVQKYYDACPESSSNVYGVSLVWFLNGMAVDPTGNYLYVSCVGGPWMKLDDKHAMPTVLLQVIPINSNGTLGPVLRTYNSYVWLSPSTSNDYVDGTTVFNHYPNLRKYPAKYPGLVGSEYYDNGAVFFSGIMSGIDANSYPINTGLMCYSGTCSTAYNIVLVGSNSFSIMTAAEYGVDGISRNPALYWNQVQGFWYRAGTSNVKFTPYIGNPGSNSVVACQLKQLISNQIYYNNPCAIQKNLDWTNTNQNWGGQHLINEMMFVPSPGAGACNGCINNYDGGLLLMSTLGTSYLAYHNPNAGQQTGIFFSSTNGGKIGGNVWSMSSDQNGNVLYTVPPRGIFGFNPFFGGNTQTAANTMYSPIGADTSSGSDCGGPCKVYQYATIISTVITDLGPLAALASSPNKLAAPAKATQLSKPITNGAASYIGPLSMKRPLGIDSYTGTFTYREDQLKAMGVRRGAWISGVKMRLAPGISSGPDQSVMAKNVRIQLSTIRTTNLRRRISSGPNTVYNGKLCIKRNSYQNSIDQGFGPSIAFRRPYQYLGGDLVIDLVHDGFSHPESFHIDAMRGDGVSTSYREPLSSQRHSSDVKQINEAPNIKFDTRFVNANRLWTQQHSCN